MKPEQFFAAERRLPLRWDSTDCCHTVDRWMRTAIGRSFIEADGRDYLTFAEAQNLMRDTPLPLLVSRAMKKAGICMTRSPKVGDIGVLVIGAMAVCAVRGSRHWLFRSDHGIGAAPLDSRMLGAWDIR